MNNLASSPKFKTFCIIFSLTAVVVYVLADLLKVSLFTFHPATYRLEWGYQPPRLNEGPTMYWYGWAALMLLVSSVVAFLGTFIPENVTKRIPLFLLWVLPILMVPVLVNSLWVQFFSK